MEISFLEKYIVLLAAMSSWISRPSFLKAVDRKPLFVFRGAREHNFPNIQLNNDPDRNNWIYL